MHSPQRSKERNIGKLPRIYSVIGALMEYANRADIPVRGSVYPAPPAGANPDCERIFGSCRGRIIHGTFLHGRGIIADYCDTLTLVNIVRSRSELCDGDVPRLAMGCARDCQKKRQCNNKREALSCITPAVLNPPRAPGRPKLRTRSGDFPPRGEESAGLSTASLRFSFAPFGLE